MSIRLWRGGFKSAAFGIPEVSKTASFFSRASSAKKGNKISAYANFAKTEIYPKKRYDMPWDKSTDGMWPFLVPGLTSDDIIEAEMRVERVRSKRWKPFDSPTVVGNCFPPDVTAKGDPPKSILRQCKSSATREFPVATLVMQYFNRKAGVKKLLESLETLSLPVEIIYPKAAEENPDCIFFLSREYGACRIFKVLQKAAEEKLVHFGDAERRARDSRV